MSKPGPRPEPLELKRRKGSVLRKGDGTRTSKLPEPHTAGPRSTPRMPRGRPKEWNERWRRVTPILKRAGVLDALDGVTLEMLVDCLYEYHLAGQRLNSAVRSGSDFYEVGTNGATAQHPAWKVRADRRAEFMRWSDRYGLDPSARASLVAVGATRNPAKDPEDVPAAPTKLQAV